MNTTGNVTYYVEGKPIKKTWSNLEELSLILKEPLDDFTRQNLQDKYNQVSQEIERHEITHE